MESIFRSRPLPPSSKNHTYKIPRNLNPIILSSFLSFLLFCIDILIDCYIDDGERERISSAADEIQFLLPESYWFLWPYFECRKVLPILTPSNTSRHSWGFASLRTLSCLNLPTMREAWVQSLGWEDPLEKRTATHSNILAWRIPWTEEPGRLQSMGCCSRTWLSDFHANLVLVALLFMWSQGLCIPRFINTNNVHRDISHMGPLWRDILVPML